MNWPNVLLGDEKNIFYTWKCFSILPEMNCQTEVNKIDIGKVEKILKGSLDLIQSPSVKIQIICGKVCLRCKGKTLLGVVNKNFVFKVCWQPPVMICLYTSTRPNLNQIFPLMILLKMKVMESSPGYLLNFFLLYWEKFELLILGNF